VLRGHEAAITTLAFSQDNRWLVSGSDEPTVRLWDMSQPLNRFEPEQNVDELIKLACRTAGRNMSDDEWQQFMGGQPYRETCPGWPRPENKT
jgi:WD40 repeat protein